MGGSLSSHAGAGWLVACCTSAGASHGDTRGRPGEGLGQSRPAGIRDQRRLIHCNWLLSGCWKARILLEAAAERLQQLWLACEACRGRADNIHQPARKLLSMRPTPTLLRPTAIWWCGPPYQEQSGCLADEDAGNFSKDMQRGRQWCMSRSSHQSQHFVLVDRLGDVLTRSTDALSRWLRALCRSATCVDRCAAYRCDCQAHDE